MEQEQMIQQPTQNNQPVNSEQQSRDPIPEPNLGFNEIIQYVIFERIRLEATRNPEFGQAIEAGMSKEAVMELGSIIPEIMPIFEQVGMVGETPSQPMQKPKLETPKQNESDNPIVDDTAMNVSRGLMG